MRDARMPTPSPSGGTGKSPLRSETNARYLTYTPSVYSTCEVKIEHLHSTQSHPLFLGHRGLGSFQDLTKIGFSDHMLEGDVRHKFNGGVSITVLLSVDWALLA